MEGLRKRTDPALKPEAVAKKVETSRTTITRMELGQQLPGRHLFYAILGAYKTTTREREEAIARWSYAKQDTTVIEDSAALRPKYVAFRHDESEAVRELTINYVALPGLLQTADYAAAVADNNSALRARTVEWQRRAADERQARQRLLSKPEPLHLHAIISEAALMHQVGGPVVMAAQLRHLITMGTQPNVTIQVVPLTTGAFGPMNSPVIILEFADDPENPHSVYLEYAAGGETIDNQKDVSLFVTLFNNVRALALPPDESAAAIQSVLDKMEDTGDPRRRVAKEHFQR
jgi:hypothetical protein